MALPLAGCGSLKPPPAPLALRLSPASLGAELAVAQRLDIEVHGRIRSFDAALEADAQSVRLAVMQLGQTVARLEWDGQALTQYLAPGWPDVVDAGQVLGDLQLVWWPAPAIRPALPAGWTLEESGQGRMLRQRDNTVVSVTLKAPGHVELVQHRAGYTIQIHSQGATPPFASP